MERDKMMKYILEKLRRAPDREVEMVYGLLLGLSRK